MLNDKNLANKLSLQLNCGYWSANGIYFFHKANALRFASQSKCEVNYHFFDDIYNAQNWTKEPNSSFDELCKLRAQELRDKYKYLALSFSGGADSTNVLETFLKNNIKLDEVITFFQVKEAEKNIDSFNINDNDGKNYIFEYIASVKPKLKWLSENFPDIKITIIDSTESSSDIIHQGRLHEIVLGGLIAAPGLIAHIKTRDHMLQYGQDAALIYGVDKPRLGYNKRIDKFFTYFFDLNTFLGNWASAPGEYTKIEYFYHTPTMPEIMVKSANILKTGLKQIVANAEHPLYNHVSFAGKHPDFRIIDVHCEYAKSILYPRWNNNTFQVKKMESFFWPEYTHNLFQDKRSIDFWSGQLDEFVFGVDERFLVRNKFGRIDKFKDIFTRFIYI